MEKKHCRLSDKELKKVVGGFELPLPTDYQVKFTCPECGSRNYIVVKFPRMHFFCRDCETSFNPN
ncbi:MAG: hypothetical protein IJG40_03700 [Oscillospiraceae bacterium]|nr:hypothetical protein [Oscillospiraceae bacterium]